MFNRARFRPRFRGGLAAAPSLALDFRNGALDSRFTFTRASNGWEFNSAGNLEQYGTNVPRFGYEQSTLAARGLLMEMPRPNLALWSRDFTQTAWVKTNITAALDVTGINGVANTASRLTATAGNATALQTITSASANHVTSFFVRRISGTGTVEITQNNGTTWTAITLTSAWQRFVVPVGTVANPVIGIRLGTSGDVIAVDVAQTEVEAFPTSPIITAGASVTRAVDNAVMSPVSSWFNPSEGTILLEVSFPFFPTFNGTILPHEIIRLDDGTNANAFVLRMVKNTGSLNYFDAMAAAGGVSILDSTNYSFSPDQIYRLALAYNATQFATSFNGSVPATAATTSLPTGINRLRISGENGASYVRRVAFYPTRLSNAALQGLTA